MQRVTITSLISSKVWKYDAMDVTSYVNNGIAKNNWGFPQREKPLARCDATDIAASLGTIVHNGVTYHILPAQYSIVITDVTNEYDQKEQKKTQIAALKARLGELAQQNDLTAAEVKETILKWVKMTRLSGSL